MRLFRTYDFQDTVCQKLRTPVQVASNRRRKPGAHFLRHTLELNQLLILIAVTSATTTTITITYSYCFTS